MITANILVKDTTDGSWQLLGQHELVFPPRQGEHLEVHEDDENNILYKVISVHHLLNSHSKTVDVYAVHDGKKLDVLNTY